MNQEVLADKLTALLTNYFGVWRVEHLAALHELAAESKQILAKMNDLRDQYEQAQASGQDPDVRILDQMVATSRRFREVVEQMHASSEHN